MSPIGPSGNRELVRRAPVETAEFVSLYALEAQTHGLEFDNGHARRFRMEIDFHFFNACWAGSNLAPRVS
ncbi:unnamed protein product [Linum trigynum]|uniref:Uncharacterized protein n=1 Tax=Linum trigynum TaxID=586398 RepID=A0AAV2CLA9_9ROSI